MGINRKTISIGLIAAACVLILLVVSLNSLIAKNHDRIREEIQKALGRPLKFDQLELSLWGGLGLSAKGLQVAEDPRFAATPFIQTKGLRMKVRWLPLLLGRVAIKEFALEEPEIQIIKSEAGKLNISTLLTSAREAARAAGAKKSQAEKEPRRRAPVALSVSGLRVSRGRIHYIDRAAKEPFEMEVQNLEMSLKGSAPTGKAALRLAASLSEGRAKNIGVEGQIGPYTSEKDWTKYPLDLQINVDSLLLPNLMRAIPLLRDTVPAYLAISGPLSIKAKLTGSWERPKISDLSLSGPFFGAAENNTTVKGDLDLSRSGSWSDAVVKGKIVIAPVGFDRLKMIPFLRQALPAALSSEGPLGVTGEVAGSLEDLKAHAVIQAGESEVRYGDWIKKPKGLPAQLEMNLRNQKNRLVLEASSLTLQNTKFTFSGLLDESPERRLTLHLRLDRGNLSGWDGLLTPLSSYQTRGTLNADLSVTKALGPPEGELDLRGVLSLVGVQAKEKNSGRGIDQLNSKISFLGKQARIERSSLRLGSSTLAFEATVPELARPVVQYSLWSPKLNLADATSRPAYRTAWMKELRSTGALQHGQGGMTLRGNFSSSEGSAQKIPYRNLTGEILWTPGGTSFKGLSFRALGGTFRADGAWESRAPDHQRLAVNARVEGMDVAALLSQKFPRFKDHLAGKLDLRARLRAEGRNGSPLQENLRGEGETEVRQGMVKDVNLVERVLSKVTGLPGISNLVSAPLPPRFKSTLQSRGTPFDKLVATFTIAEGRIYSRDLLLTTSDYSLKGEGWTALDKTMKWNAELVMSPQFTDELIREHRNVRYLVDHQGRLAVPFRLEGMLPQVQPKLDLQGLAQVIQRGILQKGRERPSGGDKEQKRKEKPDWIQKGLDKLFGK